MVPPAQPPQDGSSLFAIATLVHPDLLLLLVLFVDELGDYIILAEPLESFGQFFRINVDEYLSCLPVLGHILVELLDAILVDLAVVGEVGDESGQAIFALEDVDLLMQGLDLLADELRDVDRFLLIVDVHVLVLADRLDVQFLLVGLEHLVQLLDDLLLVLQQLIVDALPQSHQVVEDLIVVFIELLEDHDMLVALLLGLGDDFEEVDVGGLVVL